MKKIITVLLIAIALSPHSFAQEKKQRKTYALKGAKIGALSLGTATGLLVGVGSALSDPSYKDCSIVCPPETGIGRFFVGAVIGGILGGLTGGLYGFAIGAFIPNKSNIEVSPLILNEDNQLYSGASLNLRF